MRASPPYLADFDSASAMIRALARFLHGRDFPALGQNPALRPFAIATDRLPLRLRRAVYAFSGAAESVRPEHLARVRADAVARWMTALYPRRRYPAVMIGASNGAVVHLCAALGIPWLPQTYLISVRHKGIGLSGVDPDVPRQGLAFGAEWAPSLLQANPELQLHQMHDANQDRLMIRFMNYFRVKQRRLGRIYERFLEDRLAPGGTIFLVECGLSWPVTRVGRRHVFQHGGYGGATPQEYLHGGPRVADFLRRHGSSRRRWDSPQPDEDAPEAEWGFGPALREEVEAFARRRGYRLVRMIFSKPEEVSPLVADLYRWWYARRGLGGKRLVADSFILMDPWQTLRAGAVPFWCPFPVQSSADALEDYLDTRPAFESVHAMLFAHGMDSIGLAPISRWRDLLARGRKPGSLLGVDPTAFPADFATFARYSRALRDLAPPLPMPEPLSLGQFATFLREAGDRVAVTWRGEF